MKKKIAIIGSGNAGCITALNFGYHGGSMFEIDMYHDPNVPIERVGQGTTVNTTGLIARSLNWDWWSNQIDATVKTGILYENWGKKQDYIFHRFLNGSIAVHYVPNSFSKAVRESKYVNIIEKTVENPESEIDADWIFDCRGKSHNNYDEYETLTNPLNAVILSRKEGKDPNLLHTRCVATPDGWTFVIPNIDSVSYGYLYNNTITTKEEAKENFIDLFDVVPDGELTFKNYIAKSMWHGERTILNGNRYSFIEPLEATSTSIYRDIAGHAWDHIVDGLPKELLNQGVRKRVKRIETFLLWHYQSGSKYDTPFWKYAKSLDFTPDNDFMEYLNSSVSSSYEQLCDFSSEFEEYVQWPRLSFKNWFDGTV